MLGRAELRYLDVGQPSLFTLKPTDLHGIAPIPKLCVEVGDEVRSGEPLFYDRLTPGVKFCAPVRGEIVEIRRGEKRAITEIVILADSSIEFHEFKTVDPVTSSREDSA